MITVYIIYENKAYQTNDHEDELKYICVGYWNHLTKYCVYHGHNSWYYDGNINIQIYYNTQAGS